MADLVDQPAVACSCCGELRAESDVVRMRCRPDIAVCAGCVGWMSGRVHPRPRLTPIFPVRDMTEAREFWSRTGVTVELYDAGYAFLLLGGAEIAHLDLRPELDVAANAAACYVHVQDPTAWHARLVGSGLPATEVLAQPWGMTEFTLTDPSGNHLRIGGNTPESPEAAGSSGAASGALDTEDPVAARKPPSPTPPPSG